MQTISFTKKQHNNEFYYRHAFEFKRQRRHIAELNWIDPRHSDRLNVFDIAACCKAERQFKIQKKRNETKQNKSSVRRTSTRRIIS